tara:strand:+ start:157 stop:924 length:768 start_codon:yes stop_codon:yes gene_type:complete
MDDLIKQLKLLKKRGVVAVKQSLEDEGASYDDLLLMRKVTNQSSLKLDIKIGGCEAKNDIHFCKKIKVDGIIAPMVESDYALVKFIQVVRNNTMQSLYVNFESIQAVKNLNKIMKKKDFKKLKGVVIGRSDLVGSIGLGKDMVDSKKTYNLVYPILKKIKKRKMIIKMGGSMTSKSKSFVSKLYKKKLLDIVETRNVQLKLNNEVISNFENIMKEIFKFEISWLKFAYKKSRKSKLRLENDYLHRIKVLKKRTLN